MGNYLADRRTELHLTQSDVARYVGVSDATVSRWESGNIANMRRDRIAALAAVLQTTPSFIMFGRVDTESDEKETPSVPQNAGSEEISRIFNSLSPENQAKLLELAHLYLAGQSKNAENQ